MVDINSFKITPVQGQVDLQFAGSVISARVKSDEVTALIAGQPIKLVDSAGGVPEVTALTANTQQAFGFVTRNLKDQDYPAYSSVEIALQGTVVWMTAGAAIARGAKLEVVYTTNKVITNAGTNPVCGYAYDKAAADGDLIRVYVITPQFSAAQTIADIAGLQAILDASVRSVNVTATLAEINAGKTLVAGVAGKTIKVVDYTARVSGNFASNTSVDIQSSNGTPVKVGVLAVAALTTGAVLRSSPSANTTLGAGFGVPVGTGDGIVVANVGSAATGGTSITFTINYVIA